MSDVTRILNAIERGDAGATDELLPLVYEELRLLAAQKLSHERPGQNLGPAVNSPFMECCPCLSPDRLYLLVQSNRPGGFGNADLWITHRASPTAPWEPLVNLGPPINSSEGECRPCLPPDGSALYFAWDWSYNNTKPWKARIIPVDKRGEQVQKEGD